MGLKAIVESIRNKQLFLFLGLSRMLTPFYRLSYVSSLINYGFLEILAERPVSLDELSQLYGIGNEHRAGLESWLQVGICLKELELQGETYRLKGISAQLSRAENDAFVAIVQEVTSLHHKLIMETPQKLRKGELWTLDDQDGEVVARSSRVLEPFQREAIEAVFPTRKPAHLLEVGPGSGIYIKYAAIRNPHLTALGLELQPSVVEMARRNMESWQLQDRVKIECGDIREQTFGRQFDIVTLYNNIYYFSVPERGALLEHIRTFLKPGGFLVLTTACQGGQAMTEVLSLWGATTQGCDRLPYPDELVKQMRAAGFVNVRAKNLVPGDSFYMFIGYCP